MRTPLGKVLGSGSARDGTEHFWRQRLTAVANIPLVLFLVWLIAATFGTGYAQATAMLSSPIVAIILLLAVASIFYHMRLGMQVIIEDYVHATGAKTALLMANTFFAAFLAATAGFAILKLGFGG